MTKKKGFTLIEIILSIGILSILMIMFMSIMITSTNITSKSVEANRNSLLSQGSIESGNGVETTIKDVKFNIGGIEFDTKVEISTSKDEIPYTIFEYNGVK